MDLELSLKQGQILSPHLIQSMRILQMNSQELEQFIREVSQDNPVLDLEEKDAPLPSREEMRRRLEWLESNDGQNRGYHRQDAEGELDPLAKCGAQEPGETLYDHLMDQLEKRGTGKSAQAARFLAGCLDGAGYLPDRLEDLAQEVSCPVEILERGLQLLQSLDPPGVGARGLGECLTLQMQRRGGSALARRIAGGWLEELARRRFGAIARALGVTQEEVARAAEEIRGLDPRPGSQFEGGGPPAYLCPDLQVSLEDGALEVRLIDENIPTMHISGYYRTLLQDTGEEEVREYLSNKLRQAEWVVRAVDQRRSTLLSCAEEIVRRQAGFFRRGDLVPLTMAEVACALNLHESTVSRAVRDKYLQCPRGLFPLSFFFSRGVGGASGGAGTAPEAARTLLLRLIREEDPASPLSDQKLCQAMAEQGCEISRRTVAKYRDELNIPGAAARKHREGSGR